MAKRFELLVFDWDGTLMDSAAAIVEAIQAACNDLQLSPPTDDQARHVIGLGLVDAMRHAVPELKEADYSRMVERYRHHYLSKDHELRLFAGAADMIEDLSKSGYILAVATGKSRVGLDRALQVSGIASFFHDSRCADECFSKPHPQMLEELMTVFGVAPEQSLMIGDTSHDLMMANNAGVASVAVSYGAHPPETLDSCSPLVRVENISALRSWLKLNA